MFVFVKKRGLFEYKKYQPFLVVFIAACFYFYDFFLRVSPSVLTHELMGFYQVGANVLGPIMASFFLSYSLMQIQAGLLGDHFGPKKLLIFAAIACGVATFLFTSSNNIYVGAFSRFLIGFAASFAYLAPLMLASRWFSRKYFALNCGLIQVMGCIGAIVGGAPVSFFSNQYGWQNTLVCAAFISLFLGVLFYFLIEDSPNKAKVKSHDLSKETSKTLKTLKQVCHNKQTWAIGLIGFAAWAPIAIFAELWGVGFLEKAYYLSEHNAAKVMQFVWWGAAIGGPSFGWFSQKLQSRKKPLLLGLCLSLLSAYVFIYHISSISFLGFWLFVFGLAASCQCVTFGAILDIHPKKVAGTAVGFNNMAVIAGGLVFQPLVGVLLNHFWTGGSLDSVQIFSVHTYQLSFLLIPVSSLIGILSLLFFYKESFHQEECANLL